MSFLRRLVNVLRPERLSRELDREIAVHLEEQAAELEAAGLSAEEARRRFGNATLQKEQAYEAGSLALLGALGTDLRYALRQLRASPGFAAVAVLSLALGIGANTALFSLADALVFRTLPVSHPEELHALVQGNDGGFGQTFTYPLWEELRQRATAFSGLFAFAGADFDLSSGGEKRRAPGAWVSGSFFETLGVQAAAGRLLQRADDVRGCPATAVASLGFARREFGGATEAVGRTVSLDGHPFAIAGVVEQRFTGLEVGRTTELYAPLCAEAVLQGPGILDEKSRWYLQLFARTAAPALAQAQLSALAPAVYAAAAPPDWDADEARAFLQTRLRLEPAATGTSQMRERYQRALFTLMIAVGLVLLIACVNLANLLLARAAARQRELAVRLALGAGRGRILRQLLTESALLSLCGAALGVLFAAQAGALIVAMLSDEGHPLWLDLSLDGRVLGFTTLIAVGTTLLFGLVPALKATRLDPQAALKAGGRGLVGGDSRHRLGKALVVFQVALSLALVAAAALLVGSFRNLLTLDPGFRRDGLLITTLDLTNTGLDTPRLRQLELGLLERVRASPGVIGATLSALTPISNLRWNNLAEVPGYAPKSERDAFVFLNQVSEGYFGTYGTALLSGRDLARDDVSAARPVVVVNQTLARRFFGQDNPLGRTFRLRGGDGASAPLEIVGVVRDTRYQKLDEEPLAIAYRPLGQGQLPAGVIRLSVRAAQPEALAPMVRALAAELSPRIALTTTTFAAQLSASLARPRLLATLSGFLGALALLLAVIGLYGTLSYDVARRRNEIGIRMALGAAGRAVLGMVLGHALRLVALGLALGALLALGAARLVSSFLFGMTETDPLALSVSALLLLLTALSAALVPALRAARLDPMEALREE